METQKAKVTNAKQGQGWNIEFELELGSIRGRFRIAYNDKTRKNARYKDFSIRNMYFEGFPEKSPLFSDCHEVSKYADFMLFAERKQGWLLEMAMQELEKNERNHLIASLKLKPAAVDLESVRSNDYHSFIEKNGEHSDSCLLCGRPLQNPKQYVRLKTDGNLVPFNSELLETEDQGCFPVGSDCLKKLPEGYVQELGK